MFLILSHIMNQQNSQLQGSSSKAGMSFTCDPQAPLDCQHLRALYCCRVQDKLDQAGISWDMHLFVDDSSSNAASIGNLIEQVYTKVNAEIVVLAQHNKVCKVSASVSGSIALSQPFARLTRRDTCSAAGFKLRVLCIRVCCTVLHLPDDAIGIDTLTVAAAKGAI